MNLFVIIGIGIGIGIVALIIVHTQKAYKNARNVYERSLNLVPSSRRCTKCGNESIDIQLNHMRETIGLCKNCGYTFRFLSPNDISAIINQNHLRMVSAKSNRILQPLFAAIGIGTILSILFASLAN